MLSSITPLILTYNEAPNIRRTLERLKWARQIVVLDSFSTDETLAIVGQFPHTRTIQRRFDDHTSQWNFGLEQVRTSWVLTLDADYVLSEELIQELGRLTEKEGIVAYFARFIYCARGRPLRATLYPPRAVLFKKANGRFQPDGHTQLLQISGGSGSLCSPILHDDRKPFERWLQEQTRYTRLEAEHLLAAPAMALNMADRLRRKVCVAPFLVFFYTLFGKGLILDGLPGCHYVFQRTLAEAMLSWRIVKIKLQMRRSVVLTK